MQIEGSGNLKDKLRWLPTTVKEMKLRGWTSVDVVLFSGDAYVDHPSFPAAVVGRIMEAQGLKVAIVAQPNWKDDLRDFKKFGEPNLFFAVSAGAMDSMVNHYTANKRLRSDDAYTPDGRAGARPDYATDTYCSILKDIYPDTPIIIGGIEASLRRVTHYDYWSNELRPSILKSSGADLLFYGMGEKSLPQFIALAKKGVPVKSITNIPQTAFIVDREERYATNHSWEVVELASHKKCLTSKESFASNFKVIETESNSINAKGLMQMVTETERLVVNPPFPPMEESDLDATYSLPFTRLPHPKYGDKRISAYEMIRHSINSHRGCFGGCSFCTISAHQGKFIVSRSKKSIMNEAQQIVEMPDFRGTITDVGGPSANMYRLAGIDKSQCEVCKKPSCIFPKVCRNLDNDHGDMLDLYKEVKAVEGIKHLFIGSGIRYDMLLDKSGSGNVTRNNDRYLREVIKDHVSGRLKVAPEHTSEKVLKQMRKPPFSLFVELKKRFDLYTAGYNIKRELIPYFISSHPACELEDMADLAVQTKELGYRLEQIQDFTPTPMTLSTVIYYSGIDPYSKKEIVVAKEQSEKLEQRKLFFWYKGEFKNDIQQLLKRAGLGKIDSLLFKTVRGNSGKSYSDRSNSEDSRGSGNRRFKSDRSNSEDSRGSRFKSDRSNSEDSRGSRFKSDRSSSEYSRSSRFKSDRSSSEDSRSSRFKSDRSNSEDSRSSVDSRDSGEKRFKSNIPSSKELRDSSETRFKSNRPNRGDSKKSKGSRGPVEDKFDSDRSSSEDSRKPRDSKKPRGSRGPSSSRERVSKPRKPHPGEFGPKKSGKRSKR